MRKIVVGASRALSAQTAGHAIEEQLFFSYSGMGRQTNPVIHAAYAPAATTAGNADAAPQALCGFECVTLLLQGALRVRDSAGHDTRLAAGDVLWHSAGSGLLRQDSPAPGLLEQLTLWINLPAEYKGTQPHCQPIRAADIPRISLTGEDGACAGQLRLIAGQWQTQLGPAETVQPLQLWDMELQPGSKLELPLPHKWYAVLLVLQGSLHLSHWPQPLGPRQMAMLDAFGDSVGLQAQGPENAHVVMISGQPLNEALSGADALVLNTPEQLRQAQQALASGGFGTLPT